MLDISSEKLDFGFWKKFQLLYSN